MNLYVVQSEKYGSTKKYIVAPDRASSINKWFELVSSVFHDSVTSRYLCKREEIVPCVDPAIEFAEMKEKFYDLHSKKQSS